MKEKIPNFKNDKEVREFWDKHSPADFEDELKPTKELVFAKPQKEILILRMDSKDIDDLKKTSQRVHIPHSTLARMWIVEKLHQYAHQK